MPDGPILGDSQGILALGATVFLGLLSWWNLRKGQHDTNEIAADAQSLQRERFEHEQTVAVSAEKDRYIATLREEAARLTAAREADEDRHRRDLERLEARHRAEHEHCAHTTRRLHDDFVAVAVALRSEVEKATALEGVERAEHHLQVDHSDEDPT